MPVLPDAHIRKLNLIRSEHPLDVQPAGVDLRLRNVHVFEQSGHLTYEGKKLPLTRPLIPDEDLMNLSETVDWWLSPGHYLVDFFEEVDLPNDVVAYLHPRSSLLRMGLSLQTAVWDPGYTGSGQSLLIVHNHHGVLLERGARIAQMTFHRLEETASSGYSGAYQHEGLYGVGVNPSWMDADPIRTYMPGDVWNEKEN